MPLTLEQVRKVALLSRLELDEDEIAKQAVHLNRLIEQFEVLQNVDVTNVEPTSHSIPMHNVFREDVVKPSLLRDDVLANAPEARDGCFIVPRILEG